MQGYWQKLLPASLITASNPVKHDVTLTEYIQYTGPSAIGTWTENVKVSPYGPNQLWFFNDTSPLAAYYSINGSATQITAGVTKSPGQVLFDFGPSGLPIGTIIKLVTTLDFYNYVTPTNKFTGSVEVDETATSIPEPASLIVWGLLGAGWVGASVVRGRRGNVGGTSKSRAWSTEQRDAIRRIVLSRTALGSSNLAD